MSITTKVTVKKELTPIDLLLWRQFRYVPAGMVEDTLDRNRNLADAGVYLPLSREIEIARNPAPPSALEEQVVNLWD